MSIYPGEKPYYGVTTERDIAKLNLYPELLEALERIANTQRSDAKEWSDLVYRAKDIARAAIEKAKEVAR